MFDSSRHSRRRAAVVILVLALIGTGGCASTSGDGRPQVIAAFYPLQFVADRIVGDHADVTDLTNPGVEPHDLELTVRQTARLSAADVVIYEKGLAPAVDAAVANDGPKHALDTTTVVPLQPPVAGEEAANGESMDEGDPHFWQDPTLLAKVAKAVTETMAAADPAHAKAYRRNDVRLQSDLAALDAAYRKGLAHCTVRTLVVSHDAFEYLGRRYGLKVVPIAGLSPDAEPSAKHLAQVSDLIKEDHITTVFSERLASPKLADTLASDLHIRTAVLDPIEGLTSTDPHANYLTLMRQNLAQIQKAGECT